MLKCLNEKCKNKFEVALPIRNLKKYPCPKCWKPGVKELIIKNKFATGLRYKGIGDC